MFAGFLSLMTVTVAVMATYAWFSLSGSPEIAGIIINIGGSNKIKVAPDITETVDGDTVHYPGTFLDNLDFSKTEGYEYLQSIVGLSPYSTADGINWFSADYDDSEEDISSPSFGKIASLQSLPCDSTLQNANWSQIPTGSSEKGCYVYMDFWVVAPFDNCSLRVSIGDEENGTCLAELKDPVLTDGVYKLDSSPDALSLCSRVGFLTNTEGANGNDVRAYFGSSSFSDTYNRLLGVYPEAGETSERSYDFMIYEPNCDRHTSSGSYVYGNHGIETVSYPQGSYVVTRPLAYDGARIVTADISDIVSAQRSYSWVMANDNETDTLISQIFDAFIIGKDTSVGSIGLYNAFYHDYLSHRFADYLTCGRFIRNAADLYGTEINGIVSAETVDKISLRNAPDNPVITVLNRNEPQRIRMFVWIEGQDVDCVNSASGRALAINIELAGSNNG